MQVLRFVFESIRGRGLRPRGRRSMTIAAAWAGGAATLFAQPPGGSPAASDAPYPPSPVIADVELDWSTHRRAAQGSDNFQLTWADDGHLYGAWGDGGGFGSEEEEGRVGLGFARIEGEWDDWRGFNVWGGKNPENEARFAGKSWGTLSVGGVLYSWVVPDVPESADAGVSVGEPREDPTGAGGRDQYRYIELARSSDHAATWTKASWRWWREDNLIMPTFLNFGRDYAGARDAFVYAYFIRPQRVDVTQAEFGLNAHRPGAIFLARVPRDRVDAGRDAYEWFAGTRGGAPAWGSLGEKEPVFENPQGTGWCVSAIYHPGLKRYLLATEHAVSERSAIGIYDAPEPWGPWTTVKQWTVAEPFGDVREGSEWDWAQNVFFVSFVPKWWSADGREFTLAFTGAGRGENNDSFNTVRGRFVLREDPAAEVSADS